MIRAHAFAKVNLALRVESSHQPGGLHPVRGVFTSVSWSDRLELEFADEDVFEGIDGRPVPAGDENLAWVAATRVRERAGSGRTALALRLAKSIPVGAGLGGGSADAAAALATTGRLLGVSRRTLVELAPGLGSDVPFCFVGGTAIVGSTGEDVDSLDPIAGFALTIVVPPGEVDTADVYAAWDRLEGPVGPEMPSQDLPPRLRDLAPLSNDLYPAAAAIAPQIDEWRAELEAVWGRAVALSGSGGALFAYFLDRGEAEAALAVVPGGVRAAEAVVPVPFGWVVAGDSAGAEDSFGRSLEDLDEGRWLGLL